MPSSKMGLYYHRAQGILTYLLGVKILGLVPFVFQNVKMTAARVVKVLAIMLLSMSKHVGHIESEPRPLKRILVTFMAVMEALRLVPDPHHLIGISLLCTHSVTSLTAIFLTAP